MPRGAIAPGNRYVRLVPRRSGPKRPKNLVLTHKLATRLELHAIRRMISPAEVVMRLIERNCDPLDDEVAPPAGDADAA
ncbi:MAG TPA: hypothetical protein VKS25_04265 [Solirubrobacteraceae bacterium]|nr:hypothetical protein [Solirubrobacteraceae bacterium]